MAIYTHPRQFGTTRKVSYTTVSAALATAFGSQTRQIRLSPTSACHVKIGNGAQTATSNDPLLYPSGDGVVVGVNPGQLLAVIRASGGTLASASGDLLITELT